MTLQSINLSGLMIASSLPFVALWKEEIRLESVELDHWSRADSSAEASLEISSSSCCFSSKWNYGIGSWRVSGKRWWRLTSSPYASSPTSPSSPPYDAGIYPPSRGSSAGKPRRRGNRWTWKGSSLLFQMGPLCPIWWPCRTTPARPPCTWPPTTTWSKYSATCWGFAMSVSLRFDPSPTWTPSTSPPCAATWVLPPSSKIVLFSFIRISVAELFGSWVQNWAYWERLNVN